MALNICPHCKSYTLRTICNNCNKQTTSAHYKYKELKDAPKDSAQFFEKKRNHKEQRKAYMKKIGKKQP